MKHSWKKENTTYFCSNIMGQIIIMYEGNSSALFQTCMLSFPPFTCMKQELLLTVNSVPLVTVGTPKSFAVVQEGGAQLGLTITTLAASVFK